MLGWNATQTNGTERWYGFAIYFDSTWDDNTNDPNGTIVYQWHRTNDACDTFTGQHLAFRVLPNDNLLAVNFADGTTGCNTNSTVTETSYNLGAIAKGQWTKFVVHVIWSTGSGGVPTGLLEIWKNGSKVVTQNGPNMVCDGTFPACNKSSIVRFGIYKSWWNLQNPNPDDTLIHYMDSIKIGDENASFNEVSPP
jgi:hypothetical protein